MKGIEEKFQVNAITGVLALGISIQKNRVKPLLEKWWRIEWLTRNFKNRNINLT